MVGVTPPRELLRKSTLLALTWAMEDEYCARAQQPTLFGAFQEARFFRQAEPESEWRGAARASAQGERRAWFIARDDDGRDVGLVDQGGVVG